MASPWIPEGTVFRAPKESPHPYEHTSLIAGILRWQGVDPATAGLGKRVAVAPTFESVLADKPRVVVGADAKALDLLVRVVGPRYQDIVARAARRLAP